MLKRHKSKSLVIIFIFLLLFIEKTDSVKTDRKLKNDVIAIDMKRITVEALNPKNLPQNPMSWLENMENITNVVNFYNAIIIKSYPDYAFSIIDVSAENYENLTNSLTEIGYIVNDDIPAAFYLNESVKAIGAPYKWNDSSSEHSLTGSGRYIAIVDSGIDLNHDDFNGKVIDWYDATGRGDIKDYMGHGTFVASVAAGTGASSSGKFKGVAPNANLIIAKAQYKNEVTDSINWIVNKYPNVDAISLSLGWKATREMCDGSTTNSADKMLYDSIINAINHGIPVVAAAGNSGPLYGTVEFPACINNVIAVGSVLKMDYPDHRFEKNMNLEHSDTAEIHVLVISNGVTVLDKEWEAPSSYTREISGFHYVFQPQSFPATVEVKIEGEHRYRDCYPGGCSNPECISWEPGGNQKGDDFWSWSEYFSSGPYVTVDIFVQPVGMGGSCIPPDVGWWNKYYDIYNPPNYVRIYRTNFLSTEGLLTYDSSRGPSPIDSVKPDITAPGFDICAARADSLIPQGCKLSCGNDNYISCSGTSAAVPHVSGLIALLKEAASIKGSNPSVNEIREALIKANGKIIGNHPNNDEGYGRISVRTAVNYVTKHGFSILGDVNGDRVADIFDAILLTRAFGSIPGDPDWNLDADFDWNGVINIFDATYITANYGKTC